MIERLHFKDILLMLRSLGLIRLQSCDHVFHLHSIRASPVAKTSRGILSLSICLRVHWLVSSLLMSSSVLWQSLFNGAGYCGVVYLLWVIFRICQFSHLYLRGSSISRYIRPNTYALVTGATGGIGKALVEALLRHGSNVIIHGRNEEKLAAIAADFQKHYPGRQVLTIAATATKPRRSIPQITEFIKEKGICVTILINNLGGMAMFGEAAYTGMENMSADDMDDVIALNAAFPAHLQREMIPLLGHDKGHAEQRSSLIMNLGSFAGNTGSPLLSMYSGAKASCQWLSAALSWEMPLLGRPIEVLCVLVSGVASQGNPDPPSFTTPSSDVFAEMCLQKVGCGKRVVVGYFVHAIQLAMLEMLPDRIMRIVLTMVMLERQRDHERSLKSE